MYSDHILRARHYKGKFDMAWVASTMGVKACVKRFGKAKVGEIKIKFLAEELMELTIRETVALRTSVHLIEGTIKIFNYLVVTLEDDLFRYYIQITTFPKVILSPEREKGSTQRMFKTPPTPVIKEKVKRKRRVTAIPDEASFLDDIIRRTERELSVSPTARRGSIDLLEPPPSIVAPPVETFGELDVGLTELIPRIPRSEGSPKSQLERIEELLEMEYQESIQEKAKRSSSSSADEGVKIIQVEAMVHRDAQQSSDEPMEELTRKKGTPDKDSSNGVQGVPELTLVEVMVHRTAEAQEEGITTVDQPTLSSVQPVDQPPLSDQPVVELPVDQPLTTIVPEPMEGIEEIQPVQEIVPPPRAEVTPRQSPKEARDRREKMEKIARFLSLKFRKTRRVLHLDDFHKTAVLVNDSLEIFNENEILHDLDNFLVGTDTRVQLESMGRSMEPMREEVSSSTELRRWGSKAPSILTPVEGQSKSGSNLELPRRTTSKAPSTWTPLEGAYRSDTKLPESVEIMKGFDLGTIRSTPFRGDTIEMPQKKLYEETRIDFEFPIQETVDVHKGKQIDFEFPIQETIIEVQKEKHKEVQPTVREHIEKEPEQFPASYRSDQLSPRKREEERNKRDILERLRNCDESQGYLLLHDLIPEPKHRMNAARTFSLLLTLAKEQIVCLLPEENSLEVKYVKKGTLLL